MTSLFFMIAFSFALLGPSQGFAKPNKQQGAVSKTNAKSFRINRNTNSTAALKGRLHSKRRVHPNDATEIDDNLIKEGLSLIHI